MLFFIDLFISVQKRQVGFRGDVSCSTVAVKVLDARHSDFVVKHAHRFDKRSFDFGLANHVDAGQEVIGHGDERVPGPSSEPIHGAAAEQPGKLQGSISKFFADLKKKNTFS